MLTSDGGDRHARLHGGIHEGELLVGSIPPPTLAADLRESVLRSAGRQTLILHPFLMLDPRWAAGVSDLLETIADQARAGRTWVVSGGTFAEWLRGAAG